MFHSHKILFSRGFASKFPLKTYTRHLASPSKVVTGKQNTTPFVFSNISSHRLWKYENQLDPARKPIFVPLSIRTATKLTRDHKQEEELRGQLYSRRPDPNVSTTSSVTPILGKRPVNTPKNDRDDVDMLKGLKSDLQTVKETFALRDVPREPLYFGLTGVLPYVVTSFSTLYLAWDINNAQIHGIGYFFPEETATHFLHILEPVQIGYGAVILSFLGAIHWGLEFAEYGGKYNRRYLVGLLASTVAWSTALLPLHSALLTQFAGFTGMYLFDSTASTAGYAPPWYATYRFVLTFIVGAAIVITLVGRGQIGDFSSHRPDPAERLKRLRETQRYNQEKEREELLRAKQIEERKRIEEEENSSGNGPDKEETEGPKSEEKSQDKSSPDEDKFLPQDKSGQTSHGTDADK